MNMRENDDRDRGATVTNDIAEPRRIEDAAELGGDLDADHVDLAADELWRQVVAGGEQKTEGDIRPWFRLCQRGTTISEKLRQPPAPRSGRLELDIGDAAHGAVDRQDAIGSRS
jgi:hypothetical protein